MVLVVDEAIKPHVAILPSPGMGHVIPLLEFAKRLVIIHNFHVSFLVITTKASTAQNNLLHSSTLPADLHVIHLPPVDVSNIISDDMPIVTRISLICQESLKPLRSSLIDLNRLKALIIDIFATQAFMVCQELSIPVYTFFTSTTQALALSLYLPILDQEVKGEYVDLPEPIQLPGCKPIRIDDLQDSIRDRKINEYNWFLLHVSRLPMAGGILVNTWEHLESTSTWLNALKQDPFYTNIPTPPIYPIGPLVKHDDPQSDVYIMSWLNNQPCDSVLFVALGSGGTLRSEQLTELAWGLEASKQRFILVVQKPSDVSAFATFFNVGSDENDPVAYLPEGFVRRTEGVGLVVPSWAPQVAVLRHEATGGFLSHCGWNSTLESMVHGVPMIASLLYAEQKMNATMLTEEIGVVVKPAARDGERVIRREEIERVVRLVMEGEEGKIMRRRTTELQESAEKALSCGGSSYESLTRVVESWKK